MRLLVVLLCLCGMVSTAKADGLPDPSNCSVEPCDTYSGLVSSPFAGDPPAAIEFVVGVLNELGDPIPNAFVEVIFGQHARHFFCPDAVLSGRTDPNGRVTLALAVGGWTIAPDAVQIRADNVVIRSYSNSKSPDFTTDGHVGLADLVYFGAGFQAGASGCTDLNNDGVTGLTDFSLYGACHGRGCR